ncbi:MAG: exo-alpha-sialidase [Planctomycetes bacterium]|nr:exo-alpha-sialidase [Planctomycetota bacterium]
MHRTTRPAHVSPLVPRLFAAAAATLAPLAAQCPDFDAMPGLGNTVLAVHGRTDGDAVVGGVFTAAGSGPANRIARWNGSSWSSLGSGLDNTVRAIVQLPNGDLVAAGDFANAGGAPANRIARWDGGTWSPLGSGVGSTSGFGLYALAVMGNGDLFAGGYFQTAGGVPSNAIARWSGGAWSAVPGLGATVFALLPLPNGELVVGGNFGSAGGSPAGRIARWNGSTWAAYGTGITGFRVNALARLPNGDLVAGGAFTAAGGSPAANIARWNGSSWSPLGSGTNGDVLALTVLPNGELIAGGQFSTAGGIPAHGAARWNGTAWSSIGFASGSQVYAIARQPDDTRLLGGFFFSASGTSSPMAIEFGSSCPATASNEAPGCPGSGGETNLFEARSLPWAGGTYQLRASDLPDPCFCVIVIGFSTTLIPLASAGVPAAPSCFVAASPDALATAVVTGGQLEFELTIPNTTSLIGAELHQQLALLEDTPAQPFTWFHASLSNLLSATVGWL